MVLRRVKEVRLLQSPQIDGFAKSKAGSIVVVPAD